MDLCNFRCGNKVYEKKYGSHGLTTLHKKHINMKGNKMEISFVGKKGVQNTCFIKDQKIQKIIKKMYESTNIKNPYIFSLKDPENKSKYIHITIKDVNKYLEKYSITSKNLRTWNANIIFLKNFKNEVNDLNSDYFNINITSKTKKFKIKKGLIKEAIRKTSESLHHTPSICKSSYIYKKIINDILEDDKIIKSIYNKNISSEELLRNILK
jgi:DNA topoisomerase-1